LEKYAKQGVTALAANTPVDSGVTADSWGYEVIVSNTSLRINWTNKNIVDNIPIVILLQYGHGTRAGTYVQGRDFINPAIRPIFDRLSEDIWKEVTSL
jgi:hypothetical protein